jgi:hypothetical protein
MRSFWSQAVLTLLAALMLAACGTATPEKSKADSPDDRSATESRSEGPGAFTRADAHAFSAFPLYWLGGSFDRLPLSAITRRNDAALAGQDIRADYVGFVYGDCVATDETGCPPPLEVQVWPACQRALADYALTPAGDPVPHRMTRVRGVPAASFERGLRLELYTGDVTVVIFGLSRQSVLRAAAALHATNGLASDRATLPQPVRGAMQGHLRCAK